MIENDTNACRLPELPTPTQLEVEFTNRCNARCVSCPRHNMPGYGLIRDETLKEIISLYKDYRNPLNKSPVRLVVAGGGEPFLHARAPALLEICHASGMNVTLISNGSRLHKVDIDHVMKHVDQLLVSFWGIEPKEYEAAMKLDFYTSLRNVEAAIEAAARHGVSLAVQWLRTPHLNSDEAAIRKFWRCRGVTDLRGGDVMWDRAGTLKKIDESLNQSKSIAPDFSRRVWCSDLYFSDCYAWNGDLVLCCCDFFNGQRVRLGHISDLSLDAIAQVKMRLLENSPPKQCAGCHLPRRQRPYQLANSLIELLCEEDKRMVTYQ